MRGRVRAQEEGRDGPTVVMGLLLIMISIRILIIASIAKQFLLFTLRSLGRFLLEGLLVPSASIGLDNSFGIVPTAFILADVTLVMMRGI